MKNNKFISEQVSLTDPDAVFFTALADLKDLQPDINPADYYRYLNDELNKIQESMGSLTDEGKKKVADNISQINDIFKTTNQNAYSVNSTQYDTIKDSLTNVWKNVYTLVPTAIPPAATGPSTTPSTPTDAPTVPEPNQETLNAAFAKYMGSSYNPNSPMDKGKMETVKNALKKFQEENNKPFDMNDSEDLNKMRSIMNAAYQSEEYKKVAGVSTRGTGSGQSTASSRQQTPAQRKATSPASPKGGPTYYIRSGFNRYVPAVEADITSGQQLFMQNPNRAARMIYPYVKVDSRPVRRATPAR